MSEITQNELLVVVLAPLVGSIVAGLFGKTVGRRGAHLITILGVLVSFISIRLLGRWAALSRRHPLAVRGGPPDLRRGLPIRTTIGW